MSKIDSLDQEILKGSSKLFSSKKKESSKGTQLRNELILAKMWGLRYRVSNIDTYFFVLCGLNAPHFPAAGALGRRLDIKRRLTVVHGDQHGHWSVLGQASHRPD